MNERLHLTLRAGSAARDVLLADYLDAPSRERTAIAANAWIKALRLTRVDGASLRERFTYRGDSLWWFIELYLHKSGAVNAWFETAAALEACLAREAPSEVICGAEDAVAAVIGPAIAARHGAQWRGASASLALLRADVENRAKAWFYHWSARAGRRVALDRAPLPRKAPVLAFVHSAFWREKAAGGSGSEGYIDPVLRELGGRAGEESLALVGVGPPTNFRIRRWWHGVRDAAPAGQPAPAWTPVEALAPPAAIAPSRAVWQKRHATLAALTASRDIRRHAELDTVDVWPLVKSELAGVTLQQLPWSARAMDEAGAAIDAVQPQVVITYAEAGGWGRAIMLEARRRGIATRGLQHGFIYRHWLNYLHEADEMRPAAANPGDRGFPRPDVTLAFDGYAEAHLTRAGCFPPSAVAVVGSPRLDALVARARAMDEAARSRTRMAAGAGADQHLVVVASKYSQIRPVFPSLVRAAADRRDVHLVVKCHPAEAPEPYARDAAGAPHVSIAPASADLDALMAAARLLITVNSTVAIDALVLGVPTLVVNLPSNLSPFVEAGVMAGAGRPADVGPMLAALVSDESRRAALADRRAPFLASARIGSDGQAAARTARAILQAVPARSTPAGGSGTV